MRLITVSTCSLQQWSLAWEENRRRILNAVSLAKEQGSSLLVTPELSVSGYSCEDHFLEPETQDIALEVLATIIADDICEDILIDVGLPVLHHGVLFNARCLFKDHKILLFRCKQDLANDDLFRETRWFAPWDPSRKNEKYVLSKELRAVTGQDRVPIGAFCIEADDCSLAAESCEELFTPKSPHISMGLNGIEILTNSSGSHHSLRKLDTRIELIVNATKKNGGVYIYSNQIGIDGQPRMMFDGSSMIVINGEVKALTSQFSLSDETMSAVVDLDEVTSHRSGSARRMQAIKEPLYPSIPLNASLTSKGEGIDPSIRLSPSIDVSYLAPEAEIALGPAAWLWSYLVKSRQSGFFLPLSGGIDSASTAVIVYSMCRMVAQNVKDGNQDVIKDLRRTCGEADESNWLPEDPKEICNRLFHTCYMGSENSSKETRDRSQQLAESIGSFHFNADIDLIVAGFTTLFRKLWGFDLRYKVNGGKDAENIALQNIQARSRMVLSYLFAQTLTLVRKRSSGGTLLVLGSANVDETLRGYYTKYDCSSADVNPIASISKLDLRRFIKWAITNLELPVLTNFLSATPVAELVPLAAEMTDEQDMGLSYEELSIFGRLRRIERLGPFGMFQKCLVLFQDMTPRQVFEKVRRFNHYYGINRHKTETLTIGYHAEAYSPDSNRHDLRPILYPTLTWAYNKCWNVVERLEKAAGAEKS